MKTFWKTLLIVFMGLLAIMATSVHEAHLIMSLEISEDLGLSSVQDDRVTHKMEVKGIFKSNTTPDAELVYYGTVSLTAGSATIDLTSLSNTKGETISSTGKKVRMIFAQPDTANTGAITLATGSSNGYGLKGASWSEDLTAGQAMLFYAESDAPDVATDAKTIDLSGTGSESITLLIVFG